ncbi:MAG TPA: DUF1287 domain-containing protein, partial [Terriglobales bacterium]
MRARVLTCVGLIVLALCAAVGQSRTGSREEFTRNLVAAAVARASVHVRYVPAYVRIPYPGGDVPADTGVC